MDTDISSNDDVIDSRSVIERIEELKSGLEGVHHQAMEDMPIELAVDFDDWVKEIAEDDSHLDQDEAQELVLLLALEEDAEGYASDWRHGAQLIRDDYFTRYAEQLAGDIGAIDPRATWPLNHIDWEAAAEALKVDYTSVEFDGVTYWVR